jgi:cyclophilin family peptidyl-prolyl cis-trans isomerase
MEPVVDGVFNEVIMIRSIACALTVPLLLSFGSLVSAQTTQPITRKTYTEPPKMTIDVNKTYIATIDTAKGKIVCELYPKDAPQSVNSFVFLARDHFYDGLNFHRVEPDFVIQGGDPNGDGTGGPGYTLPLETANATHKHDAGALAMARSQDPNSAGSQFYITLSPQPALDGAYTVFGQCTDGMDVVKNIKVGDVIKSITIEEK